MTEVEKLYSLAGVEKEFDYLECHRGTSSICCPLMDYESERDEECEGCVNSSKMQEVYSYPEFTAEKQIELIKWLCQKCSEFYINFTDCEKFENWGMVYDWKFSVHRDSFEDCLCGFTITLWQDLTKEEQKQIREILK